MFLMPDVSHWQGHHTSRDFEQAKKIASAIMFKATEGASFVDPEFVSNVTAANSAGLPWGAYHFVRQGDGAGQADHAISTSKRVSGCRFVCIDWEDGDRQTAVALTQRLVNTVGSDVRTGGYFGAHARETGGPLPGLDFAMVPSYGPSVLPRYRYPDPYPLAAWQYTNGTVNGTEMPSTIPGIGPCDVSVVYLPEAFGLGEEDDVGYDDFKRGWKAYRAGGKEPKEDGDEKFGWNAARYAAENPEPKQGSSDDHSHVVELFGETFGVTQ